MLYVQHASYFSSLDLSNLYFVISSLRKTSQGESSFNVICTAFIISLSSLLTPIPLTSRSSRTQQRSWRNSQNSQQGFALPCLAIFDSMQMKDERAPFTSGKHGEFDENGKFGKCGNFVSNQQVNANDKTNEKAQ